MKIGTNLLLIFCLFCCQTPNELLSDGKLIVLNKLDNTAYLVDLKTSERIKEFKTGLEPHEIAISSDQKYAAISNYKGSSLTIISLENYEHFSVYLGEGAQPHGIAFIPDSKKILVTAEGLHKILRVDISIRNIDATLATDQIMPEHISIGQEGAKAYVSNYKSGTVSEIDLRTWEMVRAVNTGKGSEGLALRDSELWVTNREENQVTVIDVSSMEVLTRLKTDKQPVRVAISIDGSLAVVVNSISNTLQVFDAKDKQLVRTINLKYRPEWLFDILNHTPHPVGITMHPNGNYAFVSASNADEVLIVDLRQMSVSGSIAVGDLPDGLVSVTNN